MKKIVSSIAAAALALTLSTGASVSADQPIHHLTATAPPVIINDSIPGLITPFGSEKPGKNASVHDLSVSDYSYQVSRIGYAVYTDKWLTGKTSMKVSVSNWKVLEDWGGTSNSLTIEIYKPSTLFNSGFVEEKTINPNNVSSVTFSGLSASEKYYIVFSVPNNGNIYSFNGKIS